MKLVLASKNAHKLVEMRDILSQLGVEVVLESEVGVDVDVEETGATFEENAFLKARAVMEASGLPAIAVDSGLCVDALNGAPGVYSARPVFFVPALKKTFAELSPAEKNAISHRGNALTAFREKLEQYLNK